MQSALSVLPKSRTRKVQQPQLPLPPGILTVRAVLRYSMRVRIRMRVRAGRCVGSAEQHAAALRVSADTWRHRGHRARSITQQQTGKPSRAFDSTLPEVLTLVLSCHWHV